MMKIPQSIRNLYKDQYAVFENFKKKIDELIQNKKNPKWHYESRLKEVESFALKIETGRCAKPNLLEDFLGCTLVVENINSVDHAEKMIRTEFELCERRPRSNTFTHKASDSFQFDDLRLYVKWKDDPALSPTGFDGLLFEVQIKTFLQHAWSIATHDLIYKSDEKNWAKERIAFQIKAMLEHAETSIQEANAISKSNTLNKTNRDSKQISDIIKTIRSLWSDNKLPTDVKRLAENASNLLKPLNIGLNRFKEIIRIETDLGKGTETLNLSPYATMIQSIINQAPEKMRDFLYRTDEKCKIIIIEELDIPINFSKDKMRNAIFIESIAK